MERFGVTIVKHRMTVAKLLVMIVLIILVQIIQKVYLQSGGLYCLLCKVLFFLKAVTVSFRSFI